MKCKVTFLFMICLFIVACQSNNNEIKIEQAIPVKLVHVRQKSVSEPIRISGILATSTEMKLSFKIGGIIDRVFVKEGDKMRKGQVLASLKLDEIQATVNQAKSGYEMAKQDYLRAQHLLTDSVVTVQQFQNVKTGMDVAKSQLDIAEFNLKHASITAPTDGRILKHLGEINELIAPGYPVFLFGSESRDWVVRVGLSDQDVVRVTTGDSVSVRFDVFKETCFHGIVHEMAGAPDPMTGTFEVEIRVQNENTYPLMSGFVARVSIFPSQKTNVYIIPMISLVEADGDHGYVFTISEDDIAEKHLVSIGTLLAQEVVIKSGLENVQTVVAEGAAYLRDGIKVQVMGVKE